MKNQKKVGISLRVENIEKYNEKRDAISQDWIKFCNFAELRLPAAIGIGEIIYEKIDDAEKILLDCDNQQIIVLEKFKNNEFVEEKKILKSLGYIK